MKPFDAIATAYCACAVCCGQDASETASGRPPRVGVTIAAPRSVPFGTWVELRIPGVGTLRRRVDDRTHRRFDGRWDVFVADHRQAQLFGRKRATVRVIKP